MRVDQYSLCGIWYCKLSPLNPQRTFREPSAAACFIIKQCNDRLHKYVYMHFASRRACMWALWARLAIAGLMQEWLDAEVPLLSKTGCLAQCFHGSCTNDFWKHGCKPGQQKTFANLPQTFRERAKKNVTKIQNIWRFWTGAFFGQNLFPNKGPALRKY